MRVLSLRPPRPSAWSSGQNPGTSSEKACACSEAALCRRSPAGQVIAGQVLPPCPSSRDCAGPRAGPVPTGLPWPLNMEPSPREESLCDEECLSLSRTGFSGVAQESRRSTPACVRVSPRAAGLVYRGEGQRWAEYMNRVNIQIKYQPVSKRQWAQSVPHRRRKRNGGKGGQTWGPSNMHLPPNRDAISR